MITATQYTRTYDHWREMLHQEAKRIADSTEARVWLNKNAAVDFETVKIALQCIGDMTGDYTALNHFRRNHDNCKKIEIPMEVEHEQ